MVNNKESERIPYLASCLFLILILDMGMMKLKNCQALGMGRNAQIPKILVHHTTFLKRVNVKFIQIQRAP